MAWGWRTKPRSVIKTIQWFKAFEELDGEDWNYSLKKLSRNMHPIHPIRRKYYYNTQIDSIESPIKDLSYEEYLSGDFDGEADSESNARNDLATYKFFGLGFIDSDGKIRITKSGKMIAKGNFDSEIFLKLLLKMHFPALSTGYGKNCSKVNPVFPLKLIINLISRLEYINRFELSLALLCNDMKDFDKLLDAVKEFREKYLALENKRDNSKCNELYRKTAEKYFSLEGKPDETYFTMSDAINRALRYTGLFSISGRGNYTKVRIAEYAKKKIQMLNEFYDYSYIETENFDEYMEWLGDYDNIQLPWENAKNRKDLIIDKLLLLEKKTDEYNSKYNLDLKYDSAVYYEELNKQNKDTKLKVLENELVNQITSLNEKIFIEYTSKTKSIRDEIIEKFEDISNGDEDMAALWLECNTWKSLVAIEGKKEVKRNFTIEEDLSPRNFAPGTGNTPDMELYHDKYIIVPEVSLMTGVLQWEHEASSVIDHVLNIIKKHENIDVIGLFISSKINVRTMWQFFILNKQSWMGAPVPVIPLTIEQYMKVLRYTYSNDLTIDELNNLLNYIHQGAIKCETYEQWDNSMEKYIENWKQKILI